MTDVSPFHEGERVVQARAGVGNEATSIASFIRERMPRQHRAFYANLQFVVVAARDGDGRAWATILEGPDGFINAPNPRQLNIAAHPAPDDPLYGILDDDADLGVLGIELATRRRNRVNGQVSADSGKLVLRLGQSFGNCPQYIRPRPVKRTSAEPGPVRRSDRLNADERARIAKADTFFIASGFRGEGDSASWGMDASHRGGVPGFVTVSPDGRHLRFPDYAGNNFFNTLGNLQLDPRAGLIFVDFATGGMLHLTGRITIDWSESESARRNLDMEIDAVVDRPGALSLRWGAGDDALRRLVLVDRRRESKDVVSFTFAAEDGSRLPAFRPGQHLPILVRPENTPALERSYSLSGAPDNGVWRISVKREDRGLVSRLLHDALPVGGRIEALAPAGEFEPADADAPLVLLSAGIGLTPLVAHFHAAASSPNRPVWFIHGARNRTEHALGPEVRDLAARYAHLHVRIAYSRPGNDDAEGVSHDWTGRLTAGRVLNAVDRSSAHFLICGPQGFVAGLRGGLRDAGVQAERIIEETF